MKQPVKRILAWLLVLTLCLSLLPGMALAALVDYRTGTASYGEDVFEDVILNWGTRGTTATFLSPNAELYYDRYYEVNNVCYDDLIHYSGSSNPEQMTQSPLYAALKRLLVSTHTNEITYDQTKSLYSFADCQRGDRNGLTCFYTGVSLGPDWEGGNIAWNREHTWPQSKGLKESEADDESDIVMLRPASSSTNSSRGNKPYGEGDSTKYYDPNSGSNGALNVRGDVARSLLYGYVRWDNTAYMWGENGVIESPELLLKWMQEDPVDTWEMGRNDSVESVTGVRNVFIDYPELAFQLLGQEVPTDMVTPSGEAVSAGLSYTITAVSGNEAWGEVSVSGTTVNAAPKEGYGIQGYEVTAGNATVTQSGNSFAVTTNADCTIRIDFVALEEQTVRFLENGDVTGTQSAYPGSSVQLPEPANAAPEGYSFVGWVDAPVSATTQRPATVYSVEGYAVIENSTDFHALYCYMDESSNGNDTYQLYSGELTEGNYLITYKDGAMKAAVVSNRLSYETVAPVNGIVTDPDASLIWKLSYSGDYVTLYNESTGQYAASTNANNKAKLETAVTDNSRWTATGTETYEFVNLAGQNRGGNANLRRNDSYGFACYATTTGGALTLYKQVSLTLYYATDALVCEHVNTTEVEGTVPNCTQSGYTAGVRCSDCNAWISGHEVIEPLGHSYTVKETAPTCTETGKAAYTCTVCGSSYSETLPATGHSYAEGVCTVCGAQDPNFGAPQGRYELVTSLEDITAGGQFVIAVLNGEEYLAMDYTVVSGKIQGTAITVENNLVTSDTPPVWNIEAVEGGLTLHSGSKYLKWSSSTSFSSVTDPYVWVPEQTEGGFSLIASTTLTQSSVRGILYRISAGKFGPFATSNASNADYIADLQLYKYILEGAEDCQHSYTGAVTTQPGCESEGVKTFTCTLCGTRYTESIPALGHTEKAVAGTAPTCTESGLTDGVICDLCGKDIEAQLYIPATGHSFADGVCTVCGAEDTGIVTPTTGYVLVDEITDITTGGQFVIAVNYNGSWKAIGAPASKIDAVNITVENNVVTTAQPPVWTLEATDGGISLAYGGAYLGWPSSTNFDSREAPYTWNVEQAEGGFRLIASTSQTQSTVRSIQYQIERSRFGPYARSNESKPSEYLADLQLFKYTEAGTQECQHSYEEEVTAQPGCETEGTKTFTCSLCGARYFESIPATGHTEVPVAGTAPTCTESGLTDGTGCSVCGKPIVAQKYIPATGHDFVEGICTVCGAKESASTPSVTGYVRVSDSADITAGGKFVIAVYSAGTWKAIGAPAAKIDAVDVTVEGDLVTTSLPPVWDIEGAADGISLAYDGTYLGWSSSTNFDSLEAPYTWTLEQTEGGFRLVAPTSVTDTSTGRSILYYVDYNRFGPYARSNETRAEYIPDLQLFKYVEAEPEPAGLILSGSVTTGQEGDTLIELVSGDQVLTSTTVSGKTGSYEFVGVGPRTYTLRVSKQSHVTREYEITVGYEDVTQDVKIHLLGDINGDGRLNAVDVAKIYAHAKKTSLLTDYELACADISGDGRVNAVDTAKAYAHAKKTSPLW